MKCFQIHDKMITAERPLWLLASAMYTDIVVLSLIIGKDIKHEQQPIEE